MLISLQNPRQPKKMPPTKRQKRARLSTIMCAFFSSMGFVIFWLIFRIAPKTMSKASSQNFGSAPTIFLPRKLPAFVKPQPHLLVSHATLSQVDAYVNSTSHLGSMIYQESTSCKSKSALCEINFPCLDLETTSMKGEALGKYLRTESEARADVAVLTRKGFKSLVTNVNANQDRVFVMSPLDLSQESPMPVGRDDFMMGLFDGHGPVGHGTAHFAAMELPLVLMRNMQRRKKFMPGDKHVSDGMRSSIKESVLHLDENLPIMDTSGSTGILITRIGSYLFFSSTGDSQAFLVKTEVSTDEGNNKQINDRVSIILSTEPHKADQLMERARIEASGGQVIPKMGPQTSSRVVIPIGQGMTLALAMSRSLGDHEGKQNNLVIADPNVDVIDLEQLRANSSPTDEFFVVVASDGLLDKIPPLAVAQRMAYSFYRESPSLPLVACQELITRASDIWMRGLPPGVGGYRDDISIAVKRIAM